MVTPLARQGHAVRGHKSIGIDTIVMLVKLWCKTPCSRAIGTAIPRRYAQASKITIDACERKLANGRNQLWDYHVNQSRVGCHQRQDSHQSLGQAQVHEVGA